jgi:hypothetical protein
MVFFLGADRVVFQTRLPLSPRDEDLEDSRLNEPVLSMTVGQGETLRESPARFLRVSLS